MKLPVEEADLFFKLMSGLQFYVNQQCEILPNIKSAKEYADLSMAEKVEVRDALWKTPDLIDTYVEKNPNGLSAEELDIVSRWKRFVSGKFQIFRYLKNHSIFIGEKSQVYGVLGLYDSLEDLFFGRPLPIMIETVLLPFKGKIVYDGVFRSYSIFFGAGIRSALKEEYMAAKQNERIISTLEPEATTPKEDKHRQKPRKDWDSVVEEIVGASQKMQGGSAVEVAAFALLRASAKMAQSAVQRPDDLEEIWRLEQQARKALSRLQTVLKRSEQ